MRSPIEHVKKMMQSKTMTMAHHTMHHINQPMHWGKKVTHRMNRKGRK